MILYLKDPKHSTQKLNWDFWWLTFQLTTSFSEMVKDITDLTRWQLYCSTTLRLWQLSIMTCPHSLRQHRVLPCPYSRRLAKHFAPTLPSRGDLYFPFTATSFVQVSAVYPPAALVYVGPLREGDVSCSPGIAADSWQWNCVSSIWANCASPSLHQDFPAVMCN
jgi:hypothetical protein